MTTKLIPRIYKDAAVCLPAAAAGAYLAGPEYPLPVFVGGLVGLAHLTGVGITARALTVAASGNPGTGLKGALWVFSVFRLLIVAAVLALLVRFARLHILGLLAGLMLVYALVVVEGFLDARRSSSEPESKQE